MNWDGSGLTNLTNNPAIEISPTWSSDGQRIALASLQGVILDIFVMPINFEEPRSRGSEQDKVR